MLPFVGCWTIPACSGGVRGSPENFFPGRSPPTTSQRSVHMHSTRTFRRRIGEILVNDGVASPEQIEEALMVQKSSGDLLGSILMDMGVVSEADIARTLCVQYQLPFICLANYEVDE